MTSSRTRGAPSTPTRRRPPAIRKGRRRRDATWRRRACRDASSSTTATAAPPSRSGFGRTASFELDFEVLNVFDNVNFDPAYNPGSGNTIFQVTSGYTDINTTFDPGGRLGQIVWRINW